MSSETTIATGEQRDRSREYVAVVYFHGMGRQRHYEELARLVDAIDRYVRTCHKAGDRRYRGARLWDRKTGLEPLRREAEHWPREAPRTPPKDIGRSVAYIGARYDFRPLPVPGQAAAGAGAGTGAAAAIGDAGASRVTNVRFYEAYWAPKTVGGAKAFSVLRWLIRQTFVPLLITLKPWHSLRPIRRADLLRPYYNSLGRAATEANHARDDIETADTEAKRERDDIQTLVDLHKRMPGRARFGALVAQIRKDYEDRPDVRDRLVARARRWRWRHHGLNLLRTVTTASLLVGICSGVLLVGIWVWGALVRVAPVAAQLPEWLEPIAAEHLEPNMTNVLAILGVLASGLGLWAFLADYMGDVRQFVAYEETDTSFARRSAILAAAEEQLRHVLGDDACARVVIVAHSLGTAVALDALLDLRNYNRVRHAENEFKGPIEIGKLHYLVTMGSPIDKIAYFFAAVQSKYRVYESMIAFLRGDIGRPPFSRTGRQEYIHWINFWDAGDIISGTIETVASPHLREQRVDNVRVANFALPAPGPSHIAYFRNATVVAGLCEVIFGNRYSFVEPPRHPDGKPITEWLGPGRGSRTQTAFRPLLFALPWLMFATLAAYPLNLGPAPGLVLAATVTVLAVAHLTYANGLGHLDPVAPRGRGGAEEDPDEE